MYKTTVTYFTLFAKTKELQNKELHVSHPLDYYSVMWFSFLFFCENSCPVTVWPYCYRHGHVAAVQSSVKVTFTNILETILDQLGFEYEISMFCPKMISNLAGNLCSLLCFIMSSVVKTHAVKSVNVCKPLFNGWFKSPHFSTYNFRKEQNLRNKYVDPWVSVQLNTWLF